MDKKQNIPHILQVWITTAEIHCSRTDHKNHLRPVCEAQFNISLVLHGHQKKNSKKSQTHRQLNGSRSSPPRVQGYETTRLNQSGFLLIHLIIETIIERFHIVLQIHRVFPVYGQFFNVAQSDGAFDITVVFLSPLNALLDFSFDKICVQQRVVLGQFRQSLEGFLGVFEIECWIWSLRIVKNIKVCKFFFFICCSGNTWKKDNNQVFNIQSVKISNNTTPFIIQP